MTKNGYTLVELIVTISLLIVVLVGGTAIFYRSLSSGGISDIKASVEDGVNKTGELIESNLKYGNVISVGSTTREDCLESTDGVSGSSMTVKDSLGGVTTYSLSNGQVSSNSGVISNSNITVTDLGFTWYCTSGINDKMYLSITGSAKNNKGETLTASYKKYIILLNSGLF